MTEREILEARISQEQGVLVAIVQLLQQRVPFQSWPPAQLDALRAALFEDSNRVEAGKARVLARHLFRSTPPPWPPRPVGDLSVEERCLAERIRANLAGLVPLGAGCLL